MTISRAFYMGVYHVTEAQYDAVMWNKDKESNYPAGGHSWNDAMAFCKKLSEMTKKRVRLPTEAQWEYACRAGTTTAFFFGDDSDKLADYAWYGENSDDKYHPVGQKKPNPLGLYDMYGNAWQWCSDWFSEKYDSSAKVDPQGPATGEKRVMRGSSFCKDYGGWESRSASRDFRDPNAGGPVGFRVLVPAGRD